MLGSLQSQIRIRLRRLFKPRTLVIPEPFEIEFRVRFYKINRRGELYTFGYRRFIDRILVEGAVRNGTWMLAREWGHQLFLGDTFLSYQHPLHWRDRFVVSGRAIYCDKRWLYYEFLFIRDGVVCARAIDKVGFYGRGKGFLEPAKLLEALGAGPLGEPPAYLAPLIEAESKLVEVPK